ncbi:putative brf1-like tbp-binding domain-containing protein [Rosellinia necatrix]|uniref:Putative brf1-like tbp-binding domain-containing protein n=1 Tax=Rosellinia necatrix TaxID=77044 RepID=A0A1W2TT91_ROSNE|nr:putative brf1-like tbp-binding domain-containing protein [Rosellinia necatrix]
MSLLKKPARPVPKKIMGFQIRPAGARIKEVLERHNMEAEQTRSSPIARRPANGDRPPCPNAACPNPSAPITDGFCSACGREIDSCNIVSEVEFGETSSGAAMVQGSYVAADQGTTRNMAPGFRRLGVCIGIKREKTLREAKDLMWGYKTRLQDRTKSVTESTIEAGIRIFRLALDHSWVKNRGIYKVVPVCLYAACRREEKCDVMLIDFADLVQINVFELGHVFKELTKSLSFDNKIKAILPEDLILRFAEKLDFGELTNRVAADATRLCQRMDRDWMTIGRHPSGICGACILMAARMWNFRRTVKEIVYVVKVATQTIEQRLDEFTATASSSLSIQDFLNREPLDSRHDPPSFYKKTDEWVKKKEQEAEASGRKRKRSSEDIDDDGLNQPSDPSKRASTTSISMPPPPRPPPDLSKVRQVAEFLPKSFDSTVGREIVAPFDPKQIPEPAPKLLTEVVEALGADDPAGEQAIDDLVEIYGSGEVNNRADTSDFNEEEDTETQSTKGGPSKEECLKFYEEWERDEAELEKQVNEVINDPRSSAHSKTLATAAHLAHIRAEWEKSTHPQRVTSMDEIIGEDEFADDEEVQCCELSPEEVNKKEEIWLNANKDWMRKQQEKIFRQQMEGLGPPKRKRKRVQQPRIGEGQQTPASTPGEAAIEVMKRRKMVSKRINYDAINKIFESNKKRGPGSVISRMESETASRMTSRAASVSDVGSPPHHSDSPQTPAKKAPAKGPEEEEEEEEEEPAPVVYEYEDEYDDDGYGDGDGYDDGEGEVY